MTTHVGVSSGADAWKQAQSLMEQVSRQRGRASITIQTVVLRIAAKRRFRDSRRQEKRAGSRLERAIPTCSSVPTGVEALQARDVVLLSKQTQALVLLVEHPEWTDARIAQMIHVSRTTLYSWPLFRQMRSWLRTGQKRAAQRLQGGRGTEETSAQDL